MLARREDARLPQSRRPPVVVESPSSRWLDRPTFSLHRTRATRKTQTTFLACRPRSQVLPPTPAPPPLPGAHPYSRFLPALPEDNAPPDDDTVAPARHYRLQKPELSPR